MAASATSSAAAAAAARAITAAAATAAPAPLALLASSVQCVLKLATDRHERVVRTSFQQHCDQMVLTGPYRQYQRAVAESRLAVDVVSLLDVSLECVFVLGNNRKMQG